MNLSIALGTITTAAFLLLSNEAAAAIINFCAGFSAMLATVATLTLAADYCPPRAEGFSFAVLMSIINFANTLADNVGSFLYSHLFDNTLPPLVVMSAAFTAFAFVLVPLLRLGDKRQGDPVAVVANSGKWNRASLSRVVRSWTLKGWLNHAKDRCLQRRCGARSHSFHGFTCDRLRYPYRPVSLRHKPGPSPSQPSPALYEGQSRCSSGRPRTGLSGT